MYFLLGSPFTSEILAAVAMDRVSSPGLRISSPGHRVSSPGLRVSSPGLRVSSPGLRVSSPSHRVSSTSTLRVSSPGMERVSSPGLERVSSPSPRDRERSSDVRHLVIEKHNSSDQQRQQQHTVRNHVTQTFHSSHAYKGNQS